MTKVVDNKSEKKYYPEIDVIKGFTILVVICAHCINSNTMLPELPNRILHVFSMPLFMMASGFLFSLKDDWHTFLRKKTLRLLVPYLSFGLITIAIRSLAGSISRGEVTLMRALGGLFIGDYYWFLYALFIIMIICKLLKSTWAIVLYGVMSFVCSYYIEDKNIPFILNRLIVYPFYFIFGYLIKSHYEKLYNVIQSHFLIFCIVSTFLFVFTVENDLNGFLYLDTLHLSRITGCFMVAIWSMLIAFKAPSLLYAILKHFGKYSLQYYLNHLCLYLSFVSLILFHLTKNAVITLLLVFLIRVIGSWMMLQIEKKYNILRIMSGL